jgi:hypothetical protein
MFCSPASRMTMKKPTICHTAATTTEGIAHSYESRKAIRRCVMCSDSRT